MEIKDQPNELPGIEAKKICEVFFKDDSALKKLGYRTNQSSIVRSIASVLEEPDVADNLSGKSASFISKDQTKNVYSTALRHGGFSVEGWYSELYQKFKGYEEEFGKKPDEYSALHITEEKDQHEFLFNFFGDGSPSLVFAIRFLSASKGDKNLETLIKGLYEGTENNTKVQVDIEENNPIINEAKSILSKNTIAIATYNAAWIDDDTLVVESDYDSKGEGEFGEEGKKVMHVWRRLPEITLSGKKWTPWGRVPHFSEETALKHLGAA